MSKQSSTVFRRWIIRDVIGVSALGSCGKEVLPVLLLVERAIANDQSQWQLKVGNDGCLLNFTEQSTTNPTK